MQGENWTTPMDFSATTMEIYWASKMGSKGDIIHWDIMRVKQCHKAPMTENGNHTTYKNGDLVV